MLAGVPLPESVAEHAYGTAMFACFLAESVNAQHEHSEGCTLLDVGKVARIALVHDLAESMVTDLPRESTSILGQEAKHAAELDALRTMLVGVTVGDRYLSLWQEYESAGSPEARLVRDADKLEMVAQAQHYASAGNTNLGEFSRGHEWYYPQSHALFEHLISKAS